MDGGKTKTASNSLVVGSKEISLCGGWIRAVYVGTLIGVLSFGIGSVFISYFCEIMANDAKSRGTRDSVNMSTLFRSMGEANLKLATFSLLFVSVLLVASYAPLTPILQSVVWWSC